MTRAELHGALDRIAGEFLDSLRDGHSLSYWRQELPPQAFAVLARRSREFAAKLDQLAKAQESAHRAPSTVEEQRGDDVSIPKGKGVEDRLARLLDIRPKDLTRSEKDALVRAAIAAREMLTSYIDASVSDEEGLLAAIDEREWSAMWHRVDANAQALGKALARLDSGAAE